MISKRIVMRRYLCRRSACNENENKIREAPVDHLQCPLICPLSYISWTLAIHLSSAGLVDQVKLCGVFVYIRDRDNCYERWSTPRIAKYTRNHIPKNSEEEEKASDGLPLFVSFHCLSKCHGIAPGLCESNTVLICFLKPSFCFLKSAKTLASALQKILKQSFGKMGHSHFVE